MQLTGHQYIQKWSCKNESIFEAKKHRFFRKTVWY